MVARVLLTAKWSAPWSSSSSDLTPEAPPRPPAVECLRDCAVLKGVGDCPALGPFGGQRWERYRKRCQLFQRVGRSITCTTHVLSTYSPTQLTSLPIPLENNCERWRSIREEACALSRV